MPFFAGERLPGSVLQTLARHEGDDVPMNRVASFHTYLLRPICVRLPDSQTEWSPHSERPFEL